MHFVHNYIVYRLLSKRVERDLLLVDALVEEAAAQDFPSTSTKNQTPTDPRLHPALIKLLDAILQSLAQMHSLSIVDDSPELCERVERRVEVVKGRRCLSLSLIYAPLHKYAEALTLLQHAGVHMGAQNQNRR